MLVTEKPGAVYLVSQTGAKQRIAGVPKVHYDADQEGLLDIVLSPNFATDHNVYLTYSEPGGGGSGLALARARLAGTALVGLEVIWRQIPFGHGGQDGGIVTFDPSGRYLFLTVGERQRMTPAQDPDQATGKILRLTLDGKPAPGNPQAGKTGARTVTVIDPPAGHGHGQDRARPQGPLCPARTSRPPKPGARDIAIPTALRSMPGERCGRSRWGRAAATSLISSSRGATMAGRSCRTAAITMACRSPRTTGHPEFEKPIVYWTPVIAPAGFAFYDKALFPGWKGSAFIGGLASAALIRIAFDGADGAREAERWDMGHRIRDVAVAPDGALWVIEDEVGGRLLRLTPRK